MIWIPITIILVGLFVYLYYSKNRSEQKAERFKNKYKKVLSQKKSSEVRTGLISETISPFLDEFQHDPNKAVFIGKPIDFVVFDDDNVIVVEVKTGKSRLSKKQRRIRDQIKSGKVKWEVVRIEGKKETSS